MSGGESLNERETPQEQETDRAQQTEEAGSAPGDDPQVVGAGASPIDEVLRQVPEPHQETLRALISSSFTQVAPVHHPLYEKLNEDHVAKIIDNSEQDSIRTDAADTSRRRYQFAYFALSLFRRWCVDCRDIELLRRGLVVPDSNRCWHVSWRHGFDGVASQSKVSATNSPMLFSMTSTGTGGSCAEHRMGNGSVDCRDSRPLDSLRRGMNS